MGETLSAPPADLEALIVRLTVEPSSRRRRQLLHSGRAWWQPETVTRFYDEVVRLIHVDLKQAERMARAAT